MKTIEEMAREAGLTDPDLKPWMTDYGNAEEAIKAFAALVAQRENEAWAKERKVLRAERDHARACADSAVKLLRGIHSLLYPVPITTADGRTMVFRPKDPDPHTILQELSDRIRALPDEIARARSTATPADAPPPTDPPPG